MSMHAYKCVSICIHACVIFSCKFSLDNEACAASTIELLHPVLSGHFSQLPPKSPHSVTLLKIVPLKKIRIDRFAVHENSFVKSVSQYQYMIPI